MKYTVIHYIFRDKISSKIGDSLICLPSIENNLFCQFLFVLKLKFYYCVRLSHGRTSKQVSSQYQGILVGREVQWEPGGGEQGQYHAGHADNQGPAAVFTAATLALR